jgi:cytosine deaminase
MGGDSRKTGGKQQEISSKSAGNQQQISRKFSLESDIDEFMREAIKQAHKSISEGGIPIGSVLVRAGSILGRGHNQRVQTGDPTAHGEIDCLRSAGRQKSYRDTVIYSTLMPCCMCAGAVVQFGIAKVIAGESRTFAGAAQFMRDNGVEVVDLDLDECFDLLKEFADKYPAIWNEDIGVE